MAKLAALSQNAGATPQAATARHPAARVRSGDDGGHRPPFDSDQFLPADDAGRDRRGGGVEEQRAGRQPERDRVDRGTDPSWPAGCWICCMPGRTGWRRSGNWTGSGRRRRPVTRHNAAWWRRGQALDRPITLTDVVAQLFAGSGSVKSVVSRVTHTVRDAVLLPVARTMAEYTVVRCSPTPTGPYWQNGPSELMPRSQTTPITSRLTASVG